MKLILKKSPRFGVIYYSPACEASKILCEFAKRKAFISDELPRLAQMGFKIEII